MRRFGKNIFGNDKERENLTAEKDITFYAEDTGRSYISDGGKFVRLGGGSGESAGSLGEYILPNPIRIDTVALSGKYPSAIILEYNMLAEHPISKITTVTTMRMKTSNITSESAITVLQPDIVNVSFGTSIVYGDACRTMQFTAGATLGGTVVSWEWNGQAFEILVTNI